MPPGLARNDTPTKWWGELSGTVAQVHYKTGYEEQNQGLEGGSEGKGDQTPMPPIVLGYLVEFFIGIIL